MLEANLQREIRKKLEAAFPGSVWWKINGNAYQAAGIPDLIGCVEGLFFGIEVKKPGKEHTLSPIQKETIRRIVEEAKGVAIVATSVPEAVQAVRVTLKQRLR